MTLFKKLSFEQALAIADQANEACRIAGLPLDAFPKYRNGLTTDEAKSSPEYRKARMDFVRAFKVAREANTYLIRNHKRRLYEYRMAKRIACVAENSV